MNLKNTMFLTCFLSILFLKAQNYTIFQIDSLQNDGYNALREIGDFKGIILQEMKLIKRSKELNYHKGEITGYLNISNSLCGMNRIKESLYFLEIVENKFENSENEILKSRLNFLYGTNYFSLGLHKQSIKSFDKSLQFAYKIKDRKIREKRMYAIYDWKRSSFGYLDMMDSVYSNERKCMLSPTPMLFITIANRHLKKGKIDSSEYYINKANDLILAKKAPIEGKANLLRAFAELSITKKEYEKALGYLFESLRITQNMDFKKRNLKVYKLISEVYKNLNKPDKENEYLLKYSQLNDSLAQVERTILNVSIEKFLDDQSKDEKETRKTLYYIIICISTIIFILLVFYKNSRQQRKQALLSFFLEKKHTADLQHKINESFSEVIQLVKDNNPQFWARFQEVYPEFRNKMLEANSNFKVSELTYCAYIYLGFSTKEIAGFTFKAVKTIENNRYNLRKKLNLSPEQDLSIWIRNFIDEI